MSGKVPHHIKVGSLGERIAQRYLEDKGYRYRASNVRNRAGELDILMQHPEGWLCICEVKTTATRRGENKAGSVDPLEHVTRDKLRTLERTIHYYLQQTQQEDIRWQLDVICVYLNEEENTAQVVHHEYVSLE